MQAVAVWISNVELARAPRGVTNLRPMKIGAPRRELVAEVIDVRDKESVGWSIALTEGLGLVPLKVKFHSVSPYAGVFRFDGCVPEGGLETKGQPRCRQSGMSEICRWRGVMPNGDRSVATWGATNVEARSCPRRDSDPEGMSTGTNQDRVALR